MSYLNSIVFDSNNYSKGTEYLLNYPKSVDNLSASFINENASWMSTLLPLQERFQDMVPDTITNSVSENRNIGRPKNRKPKKMKKKFKGNKKTKKCLSIMLKRKGKKCKKGLYKYMLPLLFGLVLAKSLLIPIVLKTLTIISAKGLMMGFFSTILASILSLKGMFGSHGYQHRIDDATTRVEVIRLPKDENYYNELYRRRDYVPIYKRISYNK